MLLSSGECYVQAKQALHTALPDRLLCREKELAVVQKFIDNHVYRGEPGSMYVSGAPGTGENSRVITYYETNTGKRSSFINDHIMFTKVLVSL